MGLRRAEKPIIVTSPSGEVVEVTIDYLIRNQHVTERQARRRMTLFRVGGLTVAGLFLVKRMSDRALRLFNKQYAASLEQKERKKKELKKYKRYGAELTVKDVAKLCPDLERSTISSRLRKWERGDMDCDDLFTPGNMYDWGDLGLGPRREVEDIVVTEFEIKLGAKIEKRWNGKIAREWL